MARAGRKRKQGKRDDRGRVVQDFSEAPVQTVLKARRVHMKDFVEPATERAARKWREEMARPVTKDEARILAKVGNPLDDLIAKGLIAERLRAVALDHLGRYEAYRRAHALARRTPKGMNLTGPRGRGPDGASVDDVMAVQRFKRDERALLNAGAGVLWAVHRVVIENLPLRDGLEYLVDTGLRALDRLHRR